MNKLEIQFEKETGVKISSNYIDPRYVSWLETKLPTEPTRPSTEIGRYESLTAFSNFKDTVTWNLLDFEIWEGAIKWMLSQHHTPTEKDQPKQSAEEWNIDIDIWWQENYKNYNKCFDLTGRIGAFDMLRVINDYIDSQTKNK